MQLYIFPSSPLSHVPHIVYSQNIDLFFITNTYTHTNLYIILIQFSQSVQYYLYIYKFQADHMVLNYQLYLYSRERQFLPQHYLINYSFSFRGRDSLNFLSSYLSMNMIFLYLPCSCLDSHVVQASWVTLPCHLQEIHSYNSCLFFFFFYKFLYLVSMFPEPYVQGLFLIDLSIGTRNSTTTCSLHFGQLFSILVCLF